MWLLVLILLNVIPGLNKTTVIASYTTQEECASERDRIMIEMMKSYPDDHDDFMLACRLKPAAL